MSDELPDPWSKPAYGGGSAPPPPEPPRPPAPPTTAVPPTAGQPTSAVPLTSGRGQPPPGGPVPPLGSDVPPGGGGAGRSIALGIAIGLLIALVVGLLALALTQDDDDSASEATDVAPSTTLVPGTLAPETTPTAVDTTAVPTTTPETTTTIAATTTTVADPSGWPSGLVLAVAAQDGIRLVGPNGANTLVVDDTVDIALPLAGTNTYVVQSSSGRFSGADPADTSIRLVGPDGSTTLIEPPPDMYLRLHDVRSVNASPVVLYSDDVGDNPDNQVEALHQYTVADGTVVDFGPVGGWEASTSRIHIGGVTNVGEFFVEATSGLLSTRQDGTSIDPASVGLEDSYADCATCPRRFTITPSGQQLAWIDGSELVVTDLGTGAEVLRAGLPGDMASTVADISLDGGIAVLNRSADGIVGSESTSAVIVDLRGAAPVFVDVQVPGFASR